MIDITGFANGDLTILEAITPKAANVLQVQIGDLEYAKDFGIDLKFFLDPDLQFQNESFKAYLIQRLAESHVNVNQVMDSLETFYRNYIFEVGEPENSGGFIR